MQAFLMLFAQTATSDAAFQFGRTVGTWLVPTLLILGCLKCIWIARRETTSTNCAYALLFSICLWLFPSLSLSISETAGFGRAALLLLALMAGPIFVVLALIFGFVGLQETRRPESSFTQGKRQATWALIISGIWTCVFGYGFISGVLARNGPSLVGRPTSAREVVELESLNLRMALPSDKWQHVADLERVNPDACVGLTRSNPPALFILIAEQSANRIKHNDALKAIVKTNLQMTFPGAEAKSLGESTRGGIKGLEMLIDTNNKMRSRSAKIMYWLATHNGYSYQLYVVTENRHSAQLRSMADEAFGAFEVLDTRRQAPLSEELAAKSVTSPYGYEVNWDDSAWSVWDELSTDQPNADVGALLGDKAAMVVMAADLEGAKVSLETSTSVFLGQLGLTYPGPDIRRKQITIRGQPALELRGTLSEDDGTNSDFLARSVIRGGNAITTAAWIVESEAGESQTVEDALSLVRFVDPGSKSDLLIYDTQARVRHATFFNDAGILAYDKSQYRKSSKWFQKALQLNNSEVVHLTNAVQSLEAEHRHGQALKLVDEHTSAFPEVPELVAKRADLLYALGQNQAALKQYREAFTGEYYDPDQLLSFVALLIENEDGATALDHVKNARTISDSSRILAMQARVQSANGNPEAAIQLLKSEGAMYEDDAHIIYALLDAYDTAGQNTEALALVEQQIASYGESADLLHSRAGYEFAMNRYPASKASLERALKLAPGDLDIKSDLETVSSMMGQGDNSSIKTPIEPVSLPPPVINRKVHQPHQDRKHGAVYRHRYVAIQTHVGQPTKRTDYYKIEITAQAGVESFTSFRVDFDPIYESLYVNTLKVFDSDGSVVGEGSVDSYYIVDDTDDGVASTDRILVLPVPGLKVGHHIELIVTREDRTNADNIEYTNVTFGGSYPTDSTVLVVYTDEGKMQLQMSPGIKHVNKDDLHVFWPREVPPVYKWEPLQDELMRFIPHVAIGNTNSSWSQVGQSYCDDLSDLMEVCGAAKQISEEHQQSADDETIRALAKYVRENLTYQAIEFGDRGRIMKPVEQTLKDKYGDCKDHSLLLKNLLDAAGIRAHLALVNTDSPIHESLPSIDQFNHMIVFVPQPDPGEGVFIDCTQADGDPSVEVPYGLANKPALILDPANPRLEKISDYPESQTSFGILRDVLVTETGNVEVEEKVMMRSYHATLFRGFLQSVSKSKHEAVIRQVLTGTKKGVELRSLNVRGLQNTAEPLVLEMNYSVSNVGRLVGRQLTGTCPSLLEDYMLNEPFLANRETPFAIELPIHLRTRVTLRSPSGFRFAPPEKQIRMHQGKFMACRTKTTLVSPTKMQMESNLRRKSGQYAADAYDDFYSGTQAATKLLAPSFSASR